jgi:hypothetical protein
LFEYGLIEGRGGSAEVEPRDVPLAEWTAPEILVYRDMRNLLAMDPPLPRKKPA